jgi:ATP synthase protein I
VCEDSLVANPVWFCLSRQLLLMLGLFALVGLLKPALFVSVGLGAALFIVPQLYFTHYAFRYRDWNNAALMIRSLKWGELGKFLLTLSGFALVWRFYPRANIMVLMSVYGLFWLAQIYIANALTKTLPQ